MGTFSKGYIKYEIDEIRYICNVARKSCHLVLTVEFLPAAVQQNG